MTKQLLFRAVSVLSFLLAGNIMTNAQYAQIPNNEFENWENNFLTIKPQGWLTVISPLTVDAINRSENAVQGDFSVELTTVEDSDDENEPFAGLVFMGEFIEDDLTGVLWENTADKLLFSARYGVMAGDAAMAMVILFDNDTPVGSGFIEITGTSDEQWEAFEIPIEFIGETTVAADAISVIFLSSAIEDAYTVGGFTPGNFTPAIGSYFNVDDVFLTLNDDPTPIAIANGSFETWEDVSVYEPVSWSSYNTEVSDGVLPVTRFEENGVTGVRITNVTSDWGDLVGSLFLRDSDLEKGIPYSAEAPPAFSVTYKYETTGASQSGVYIGFKGMQNGNEVWQGGGWFPLEASEDFIQKGFLLNGFSNDFTPERLFIEFYTGDNEGSVLDVTSIEFTEPYEIAFHVNENGNNDVIPGAKITFDGYPWSSQTDENGVATIKLPAGTYNYFVSAMGYNQYSGSLSVSQNDDEYVLMDRFEPDQEELIIQITDGDIDQVYFDGDWFRAEVEIPPSEYDIVGVNATIVLFTDPETYVEEINNIFNEAPVISSVENNSFTIEGTIGDNTTTGVIGLKVIGMDVEIDMGPDGIQTVYQELSEPLVFPIIDTYEYAYYSQNGSDRGMAIVGVSIPEGDITSDPPFNQINNLYNTDGGISFVNENHGAIYFQELNIIDNRDQLILLNDGLNISADPNGLVFFVEINLTILPFLQSNWVDVYLANIPEWITIDDISIVRTLFGETGDPTSNPANNADQYNLDEGVFSFRIHDGFSRYSLIMPDESTSIGKPETVKTTLSPNPFNDQIYISSAKSVKEVRVTSINGQTVVNEIPNGENIINTSYLPTGFYIVTLIMEDGTVSTTPMIKK